MNFIAQVEEHLRDLGTEARKKHPGVKEASERAILTLRHLQNAYVAAVRHATSSKSTPHPTTSLFQSQDLLRPFLLATNYPDANFKLVSTSLNAIQLLIQGDAICSEDGIHVVRVLHIQSSVCGTSLAASIGLSSLGGGEEMGGGGGGGGGIIGGGGDHLNIQRSNSGSERGTGGGGGITSTIGSLTASVGGMMLSRFVDSSATPSTESTSGGIGVVGGYSSGGGYHSHNRSLKEDGRIALRILQTILMIVDSSNHDEGGSVELTEEVLHQCILVCLVLISSCGGYSYSSSLQTTKRIGRAEKEKLEKDATSSSAATLSSSLETIMRGSISAASDKGPAGNVCRAASATLKQIISLLFEQASAASLLLSSEEEEEIEEKERERAMSICKSATATFLDLCTLAGEEHYHHQSNHNHQQNEVEDENMPVGPFLSASGLHNTQSGGSHGGGHHGPHGGGVQLPNKSVCLELLDMILNQNEKLFFPSSDDQRKRDSFNNFPSLLQNHACPLVATTLLSFCSSTSKSSFPLLVRSTQLSSTIITKYGYSPQLNGEVHILLMSLVKFITNATESIRDTEYFEDGYVYSEAEDDYFSNLYANNASGNEKGSEKKGDKNAPPASPSPTSRKQQQQSKNNAIQQSITSAHQQHPQLISPIMLWSAALALESLHTLFTTEHFAILIQIQTSSSSSRLQQQQSSQSQSSSSSLISESDFSHHHLNNTIVGVITEAISDFCTIGASCKGNILSIVNVVNEYIVAPEGYEDSGKEDHEEDLIVSGKKDRNKKSKKGGKNKNESKKKSVGAASTADVENQDRPPISYLDPQLHQYHPNKKQQQKVPAHSYSPIVSGLLLDVSLHALQQHTATSPPSCDIGGAIWVAYSCILSLVKSLLRQSSSCAILPPTEVAGEVTVEEDEEKEDMKKQVKSLVDGSFAPSLAVLQHFLKRFPGSSAITKRTLMGYVCLANASIPLCEDGELRRKAILSSLCKLSLPCWGKNENTRYLSDHHVEAILSLIQIIHSNYDCITNDWHIILCTFEQLASLSMTSPKLSDDSHDMVSSLSKCFNRLSVFTTCLSAESLGDFIDALVALSSSSTERTTDKNNESSTIGKKGRKDDASLAPEEGVARESSLGGKLMSFAGRAFSGGLGGGGNGGGGGGGGTSFQDHDYMLDTPESRGRTSKAYSDDFCQAVYDRLAATKPTTRKDVFRRLPFSLVALTDVTLSNLFRFSSCAKAVLGHLCDIATTASSSDIRLYAMDTLSSLITSSLSEGSTMSFTESGPSSIITNPTSADEFLGVVRVNDGNTSRTANQPYDSNGTTEKLPQVSQGELLTPLCKTISSTDQRDTAEAGLNALHVILEGAGHNLSGDAWPILIEAISDLSGDSSNPLGRFRVDRSSDAWVTCSTLAFRCLKLIVDDFLDQLPASPDPSYATTRTALLDCCASFGRSQHDVNTSLTATGMLWTIADQDPTPSSLDDVLSKLAFLALDSRPEVRNCSVNTLFSCVVGLGHRFTAEQWHICLSQTIFGVLEQVATHVDESSTASDLTQVSSGESTKKASSRYKVTVHHSRDSVGKQWMTTQVLTLRGLERVLRQFFSALLSTNANETSDDDNAETPWFESAWARILDLSFRCATQSGGREVLDLRLAGVDLVVLCVLLSCRAGIVAATTPARVGTNMEVVNGALRSVQNASTSNESSHDENEDGAAVDGEGVSPEVELFRQDLFNDAFDVLERFRTHLEDDEAQKHDEYSQSMFIEPVSLQVVTKLSQGLVKIYECCKSVEMAPQPQSVRLSDEDVDDEDDIEGRFVDLVSTVVKKAVGDSGSRYLSQAQKAGIELLQTMAFGSSSRAFETLADIGGESYFWRQSGVEPDNGNHSSNVEYEGSDLLEYEVAKVVADAIVDDGVPTESKAEVLCTILSIFCTKHADSLEDLDESQDDMQDNSESDITEETTGRACFDLFVPVVKGGLQAASFLEESKAQQSLPMADHAESESESEPESEPDSEPESESDGEGVNEQWIDLLLDDIWKKMLQLLSYLVTPSRCTAQERYPTNTRTILHILSCSVSKIPARKFDDLGFILSNGARKALVVAKVDNATSNTLSPHLQPSHLERSNSHREDVEDGLRIFRACFVSLCKVQQESSMIQSIAESVFTDSIKLSEDKLSKQTNGDLDEFDASEIYDISLNKDEMEESDEETDSMSINVAVEAALIVCDALRSVSGMSGQVIQMFPLLCQLTNTNNDRLRRKAGMLLGNVDLAANIAMANRRADAFEQRALKAEKLNADLMEENGILKYENEELNQKLAIYSESSLIT